MSRLTALWIAVWLLTFSGLPDTAFAQILHYDSTEFDPATQKSVQAALLKIKESPDDISAVETLLSIEPRISGTVGTNEVFSSSDPVQKQALNWAQSLQPVSVLVASLENGLNSTIRP